jgi:hypothetical protein
MTTSKIAITLPEKQLGRVHREVRSGRAESVSGYIARVLADGQLARPCGELCGVTGTSDIIDESFVILARERHGRHSDKRSG